MRIRFPPRFRFVDLALGFHWGQQILPILLHDSDTRERDLQLNTFSPQLFFEFFHDALVLLLLPGAGGVENLKNKIGKK